MRLPRVSRKVFFGWTLFLTASAGTFLIRIDGKSALGASEWIMAAGLASALIGGGTIADAKHNLEMAKIGLREDKSGAPPVEPIA